MTNTTSRSTTSRKRVPIPAKPSKTKDERLNEAYERLGVTMSAVFEQPQITPILSKLPGGVRKAIEFLRGSSDPDARRWLGVYDSIPESVRKLLPFESFCLASNLTTKRTLELVTGACFEQSALTSNLLAAASHPRIVEATITAAKDTQYGSSDRKMLHLHSGFVPVPKSQTTIFSPGAVQNNTQNNQQVSIGIGELPQIEDKLAKINNRFNTERLGLAASEDKTKYLEAGEPVEVVDVESTQTSVDEPIDEFGDDDET